MVWIDGRSAPKAEPQALSIETFRAFVATRPDEERWELVDGVAMMMAPPTKAHQRIASNLQRLLIDAVERAAPDLTAYKRAAVNIDASIANYDSEPDVAVVDAAIDDLDDRYAERFYLVAEIVSASDTASLDAKREIYKLHPHCACILTAQVDCVSVRIDRREQDGWRAETLMRAEDVLALPAFGLRCSLADIYRGTPLEHFPAKWEPVRRRKCYNATITGANSDSTGTEFALAGGGRR